MPTPTQRNNTRRNPDVPTEGNRRAEQTASPDRNVEESGTNKEAAAPGTIGTFSPRELPAASASPRTGGTTLPRGPGSRDIRQILRDGVHEQLDSQRQRATEGLGSLASAVRQTTEHLREQGKPEMAELVDQAAEQADRLSSSLEQLELEDLVYAVERFAKRRPTVFVASAFGLGLAAARFLKSSAGSTDDREASAAADRAWTTRSSDVSMPTRHSFEDVRSQGEM